MTSRCLLLRAVVLFPRRLAPARVEDVLRQVLDIYPPPHERGLAVGDVWEQTRSLTVSGEPLTRHLSYTLIGLDRGTACVRLRGKLVGTCERPANSRPPRENRLRGQPAAGAGRLRVVAFPIICLISPFLKPWPVVRPLLYAGYSV